MKLSGDLDTIGLAELFKSLIEKKAHGILSIQAPMGEKHIALSTNEIVVFSDPTAERMRLGDLLIARGYLTEKQLQDSLQNQHADRKKSGRHSLLGDLLVQHGLVSMPQINDALRFQLEEEFFDLFSWRGGTFEFDDEKNEFNFRPDSHKDATRNIHRLSIDPQRLIREALRRSEEWESIESRLPTQYLCFKLTEKGAAAWENSSPPLKRILRFVREGRTIETIVKRSCAGRFSVCRTIIHMLDEGWLFPYPASDLKALAEEHRHAGRFADTLYVYRRLLDAAEGAEHDDIRKRMDATEAAIRAATDAGEKPEGLDLIRHRTAAEAVRRRRRIRNLLVGGLCAVLIVGGGSMLMARFMRRPASPWPSAFSEALREASQLEVQGRFEGASVRWQSYYATLEDKSSATAREVQERLRQIETRYTAYVDIRLAELRRLEDAGIDEKTEAACKRLLADCPNPPRSEQKQTLEKMAARLSGRKESLLNETQMAGLRRQLASAREKEAVGELSKAREQFIAASEGAPAGSDVRRDAEAGLARLNQIKERLNADVQRAETALTAGRGEEALESFAAAAALWKDLPAAKEAAEKATRLRFRLELAREALRAAKAVAVKNHFDEAVKRLQLIETDYPEFELTQELPALRAQFERGQDQAANHLAEAQKAWREGKTTEARLIFNRLLEHHRGALAAMKVKLPVSIVSQPPNALVALNGRELGRTPLEIELSCAETGELAVTRDGFHVRARTLNGLRPGDLEMVFRLDRAPLRVLEFENSDGGVPVQWGKRLFVGDDRQLHAFSLAGDQKIWSTLVLHRTEPGVRSPGVFGWNAPWRKLAGTPMLCADGDLLYATGNREIYRIAQADGRAVLFAKLPVEPAGPPYELRSPLTQGRTLVAVLGTDGALRVFESLSGKPAQPIWKWTPSDEIGRAHV